MARVKIAKNAGFCMGVRRAVDMALVSTRKKSGPIYTYGPLIHNPQVLEILEGKGVKPMQGEDVNQGNRPSKDGETLIIRAHGISPQERREIKVSGIKVLNATCPHHGGERDHPHRIGETEDRGFGGSPFDLLGSAVDRSRTPGMDHLFGLLPLDLTRIRGFLLLSLPAEGYMVGISL